MENIKDFVEKNKKYLKANFTNLPFTVNLVIVQIGNNQASNVYIKGKIKDGEEVGVHVDLKKFTENKMSEKKLLKLIKKLNKDKNVHGFLVQMPLPEGYDEEKIKDAISPLKDVDGFNYKSKVVPCTPGGILYYLESNYYKFEGKNAVIIGRSNIVGKPMAKELLNKNCSVTVLHSKTPLSEMKKYISMADLVVVAVGKRNMLNSTFRFKKTAVVVDVGINRDENDKLCGDCELYLPVEFQTPVPGGVGLLTRLSVYMNLLKLIKE